jgi:hypothetical protein
MKVKKGQKKTETRLENTFIPLWIAGIQPRNQKADLTTQQLPQNLFRVNTRRLRKQVNWNLYPIYGHKQRLCLIQKIPEKCEIQSGKR